MLESRDNAGGGMDGLVLMHKRALRFVAKLCRLQQLDELQKTLEGGDASRIRRGKTSDDNATATGHQRCLQLVVLLRRTHMPVVLPLDNNEPTDDGQKEEL